MKKAENRWCRWSSGHMGRLNVGGPSSERHSGETLSRQGKGSAVRDRSGIQSEPSRRKSVGEGKGEMTAEKK